MHQAALLPPASADSSGVASALAIRSITVSSTIRCGRPCAARVHRTNSATTS